MICIEALYKDIYNEFGYITKMAYQLSRYCVKLHSKTAFIAFAYITRILVGIGVGTSVTATMTINAKTFPNHIARTMVSIQHSPF